MIFVLLQLRKRNIFISDILKSEEILLNHLSDFNEGKFPYMIIDAKELIISRNPQWFFNLKKISWFKWVFKTKLFLGYQFMDFGLGFKS